MTQAIPQLEHRMSLRKAKQIQLFKNMMRYAAAAFLVLMAFVGGRLSVNTSYAHTTKKQAADHLYIFGANGAQGNLS
ncbi:MAG: hypothetical protein AAGC88_08695, partial [Bacteroidota bacterium]